MQVNRDKVADMYQQIWQSAQTPEPSRPNPPEPRPDRQPDESRPLREERELPRPDRWQDSPAPQVEPDTPWPR